MSSRVVALRPAPNDAAARRRIRESLNESLIVEASAGTGKTTELIRRLVAVLGEGANIGSVAAVTFTNKAAGELKLRLRQELDRARACADEESRRYYLEGALARMEEASIGTIHAFCAQILRERPVEAVVDPAFRELTEIESRQIFDRAFRGWIQRQLDQPSPGLRRALIRLALTHSDQPPLDRLKGAGRALVDWRDYPARWERVSWERETEIDALAERVRKAGPNMNQKFQAVADLAAWIERSEAVGRRDYDTLESLLLKLLRDLNQLKRKGAEELSYALDQFRVQAEADLAHCLREEMTGLVDRYEELKRQAGVLDFHDLLLKARDLVKGNRGVREYLQRRYSHIFVDEFQDTDPLQAELLVLLSAEDPTVSDWRAARPAPGKLFLVGDPKQSIYKFRRADVVFYRGLRDRLAAGGAGLVRLTKSFRSVRPIQQFVNAAFETEMTGDVESGQADYAPLEEHRAAAENGQPAVVALPAPRPYGFRGISRREVERCLPDTIAAFADWLIHRSGWQVQDPESGQLTPVSARHICILYRRFTAFGSDLTRDYTRALEARGIAHLLVGSRSFHAREEVETLRAALAAVEWPGDELSVFAALKGALFAIPDTTLVKFRAAYGRMSPYHDKLDELPAEFEAISAALGLLRDLHQQRNWRPVAETVQRLLEFTRAHAGFALRPGGQQILANVYRVADVARGYETEGGISFRGFVEMLEEQVERAESSEAPVLEEGSEGVRMMTVHAAKGLEFPVVILADLTGNQAAREPDRYVDSERHLCAMRLLQCTPWPLLEHRDREHARELAEGVRLAYVAATRARDLLVVPAVGDEPLDSWLNPLWPALYPDRGAYRRSEPAPAGICPPFGGATVSSRPPEVERGGEMSVKPGLITPFAGEHRVVWWDPAALNLGVEANYGFRQEEVLAEGSGASAEAYEQWRAGREAEIEQGRRAAFDIFSASEATQPPPGEPKTEVNVAETARPAGRTFGSRFGSLVHAVLRDIDFAAARDAIDAQVEMQARVSGTGEEERRAAGDAVEAALKHALLGAARRAPRVHREWPLRFRAQDRWLEGFIDLAYFDGASWHIVDYKTDHDFASKRRHYETQLRWYVHAVAQLTGQPARGWLLRL